MNKKKRLKKAIVFLFFILMSFGIHISYAIDSATTASVIKISDAYLCDELPDGNTMICDLGEGKFQARFVKSISEIDDAPEYLAIKTNTGNIVKATGMTFSREDDEENKNFVWWVTGTFNTEDVRDALFMVNFKNSKTQSEGYIPALKITPRNFSSGIEDKLLELQNISFKDINITNIENGRHIDIYVNGTKVGNIVYPIKISSGHNITISLHPNTNMSTDSDSVNIKYEIENAEINSQIKIILSNYPNVDNKTFKEFVKQHPKSIVSTLLAGGFLAEEAIRRVINLRPNIEDERARDQNERHELELEGAQGITPQVLDVAFYVDKVNRLAIKARSTAFRAKAESDRAEGICPPPKAILAKTQSNQADRSATDAESAARIAQTGLNQFRNKQITCGVALNLAKVIQFNKAKQAVRDAEAAANRAKAIADSCVGSHDDSGSGCMTLPAGSGNTGLAERGASIPLTGTECVGSAPPLGAGLRGYTESSTNTEKQPIIHGAQQSSPTVDDYAEKNDGSKNSQSPPPPSKNNDRYGLEKLQRELTYFGAWPQANNIFIPTSPLFDKGDFFPSTFEILGNQPPSFSGLPSKGTSTEPITHLKYTTPTYIEYQKYQAPPQYMGRAKYQTQTYIEYPNYPTPPPYRIPSTPPKIFGYQR